MTLKNQNSFSKTENTSTTVKTLSPQGSHRRNLETRIQKKKREINSYKLWALLPR